MPTRLISGCARNDGFGGVTIFNPTHVATKLCHEWGTRLLFSGYAFRCVKFVPFLFLILAHRIYKAAANSFG